MRLIFIAILAFAASVAASMMLSSVGVDSFVVHFFTGLIIGAVGANIALFSN